MTLGLPIFEKQQVGRGGLVLYLPQRAAQSLGPWTVLPSTVGSHRFPSGSWRTPQLGGVPSLHQSLQSIVLVN